MSKLNGKKQKPGRKPKPIQAPETSAMINSIKLVFAGEIEDLVEKRSKDEILQADVRKATDIMKTLLLVQKEERAEKALDDVDSMTNEEIEEIVKEANKKVKLDNKVKNESEPTD